MIQKLFSSQVMFSVLSELFKKQDKKFSVADLTEVTGKKQPNIKKELDKLLMMKLVDKEVSKNINYYSLNKNFTHFSAFSSFFDNYFKEDRVYILFNEEDNSALFSLQYILDGFTTDYIVEEGVLSFIPEMFTHFKNNYLKFYMEESEVKILSQEGFKVLKENPSFIFKKTGPISLEYGKKGFSIFEDLKSKNFKVSRKEFSAIIDNFKEIVAKLCSYNMIAVLELKDYIYSNYLKDYLKKKTRNSGISHFFAFERLLAPEDLSYTQFLKIELLEFVIDSKPDNYIKEIHNNWVWLNFGYRGSGLDFSYIKENIEELKSKDKEELLKELNGLKNYKENIKKEKEEIFKKLKIDLKHQNFINALSFLSFLKVYRKDIAFLINYCTFRLIDNFNEKNEFGNFYYLSLEELKEIISKKREVDKKELVNRESESLYHSNLKKIFTGKDAVNFLKNHNIKKEENGDRKINLLDGMTACLGETGNWIYGQVKIINSSSDMSKMKEGDILVSVATTPDILLAMKKASAIVTDHGGITCHAAIVSRELNKPCLIGTKYATKVFKDGDKVVVCPRHGYIKFQ